MNAASLSHWHEPMLVTTPSIQDKVTLNPQPLPPRVANPAASFSSYFAALQKQLLPQSLGDRASINPQPLPPKDFTASALTDGLQKSGIIIVGGRLGIR